MGWGTGEAPETQHKLCVLRATLYVREKTNKSERMCEGLRVGDSGRPSPGQSETQ